MSTFTTRVELHHASDQDYTNLHQYMEAEGFSRVIKGGNGVWYHLPTAEYYREANLTIEAIRESAGRAAARTRRIYAVLVSETLGTAWVGLNKVESWATR